ncbi:amino acid ABC transporter ATP-binding/permease protein [Haloimpatiens lingqiaonensis]|uniref:amino acid ABC transporter ATP-binding/permease protein n=1 Tax=Haloimpatiens lingqiaonensis TaxID=1380675 RepID=UPI001FAAEA8F|nr:ABC transporter ATP-binding protein [Haloimpatiens lingqiaonensis]
MPKKRRSGITIMLSLIGLVKPLIHVMLITITMGVLGYLASIFITVYGSIGVSQYLGFNMGIDMKGIFTIVVFFAVIRGFLRYLEQYSGHYIAFKLLAILRDNIFKKLRELSPAKLEGQEKGNLISIITTDIELLEVFYAHTIAPVVIGVLTSLIMILYIGKKHVYLGMVAFLGYFTVGFIIPYFSSKLGNDAGVNYRNSFGKMNSYMLDSLKGIKEIIMFNLGDKRLSYIDNKGKELNNHLRTIKKHEGIVRACTDTAILSTTALMLFLGVYLLKLNLIDFKDVLISTVAIMSSFGPVVALSNLSNTLVQTLASGERVLNLLEEEPMVREIYDKNNVEAGDIKVSNVSFSYMKNKPIIKDLNLKLKSGKIIGIVGESGSGKSTLLKLFMRFWDATKGSIEINNEDIKNVNTDSLRNIESFVTQETFLFNDTIE